MPGIITVTFNPAIDKSTTISSLAAEKKLRCSQPHFEPGGGGLNVARAIHKLGGEALAFYPAGGYSGKFLTELLKQEGVPSSVVETKSHSRENLIVLDKSTNQQYRFGMPGSPLQPEEWEQLLKMIREAKADYVVASGSLPPNVPENIFGQIAALCHETGSRLIVDTSGEALKKAVEEGVFLFKPNLGELSSLVGREEIHQDEVTEIAREILDRGSSEAILVSMRAAGARLVTPKESFQVRPPVVKKQSTVGAGDSMVAGVVLGLFRGMNWKEAVSFGVACGTAATLNPGTQLCKKEDVERLYPQVHVS